MARLTVYSQETLDKVNDYLMQARNNPRLLPTKEEIIDMLDITAETLNQWCKVGGEYYKEELSEAIKKIENLQLMRLKVNSVGGAYNPASAIFQMKVNHGMLEIQRTEITGADGKDLPVPIIKVDPPVRTDNSDNKDQ